MSCSFEDETKACGRRVGLWAHHRDSPQAAANAAYAREHMVLRPHRCSLGIFNASRLAEILAGGKTLRLVGDSTMIQVQFGRQN